MRKESAVASAEVRKHSENDLKCEDLCAFSSWKPIVQQAWKHPFTARTNQTISQGGYGFIWWSEQDTG